MPQGSVPGPLLFLDIHKRLSGQHKFRSKAFADDTSLFTVVYNVDIAADKLNKDLEIISNWVHQWKMQFNPDKDKQVV